MKLCIRSGLYNSGTTTPLFFVNSENDSLNTKIFVLPLKFNNRIKVTFAKFSVVFIKFTYYKRKAAKKHVENLIIMPRILAKNCNRYDVVGETINKISIICA